MNLRNKIKSILRESFVNEQNDDLTPYKALRLWIKDKITLLELEGSDDSIERIRYRHGHRGDAEIVIDVSNDNEFFDLLDLHEDDAWFARAVLNGNYEFEDGYQIEQDFKEGYNLYGDLDDENSEIIKEIILLLTGKIVDISKGPDEMSEYSALLLKTFPNEIDNILYELRFYRNEEMNITAENSIMSELNGFMEKIGFSIYQIFNYISTTPGNLLMWYARFGDKTLNFKELFKLIIENSDTRYLGGWADSQYEFRDDKNFNSHRFNRDVNIQLEKILDKLKSEDLDFEKFREMVKYISSKFNMNIYHELPKDKNYVFAIQGFNIEDLTINLIVKPQKEWKTKKLKLSLDNFNKFLYQPELFGLSDLFTN